MMIFSLVAMIGLEKCYIASANLQWLCHSGERVVAHGPLVLISAQNIDYGYSLELPQGGGSNEYPQSMFLSRNKKNNVYPVPYKPQFYYMKVGFKELKII